MSFGGSVSAMIISIRNNRNLLGKKRSYTMLKKHLKKEYELKAHQAKKAYQGKKVSKEESEKIKQKIKEDLRRQKKRSSILIYSFTILILGVIYWAIFI